MYLLTIKLSELPDKDWCLSDSVVEYITIIGLGGLCECVLNLRTANEISAGFFDLKFLFDNCEMQGSVYLHFLHMQSLSKFVVQSEWFSSILTTV